MGIFHLLSFALCLIFQLSESVTMGKEKLENHIDNVEWGSLPQYTGLPPFNKCKPKLKPLGAQTNTPKVRAGKMHYLSISND